MRNGYKHKAVLIVVSFRVGCLTASASEPLILSSTHHSAIYLIYVVQCDKLLVAEIM